MATKNMTTRKGKMTTSSSSLSDHTVEQALDDLRMQNSKLRAELDAERSSIKQLKHEKSHQAKVIRDEEQTRASIALKDVKMKIVQEKAKELDSVKDSLHRKFDADLQKVTKQKDAEIHKLHNDLKKCQNELSEVTKRGLSGAARGVFEAEREKMLHELQELRVIKRSLEESLQEAVERDRQKMAELKRLEDQRKSDLNKAKKDSDIEIRKLLDELRSKERSMAQLEREVGAQSIDATKLRMEKESMQDLLSYSWDSETWQERTPRRANSVSSVASPDGGMTPDVVRIMPTKEDVGSSGNMEKERKLQHKISELNAKVRRLDDQCTTLAQDKMDLVKRIKELEKGRKPLQEKNRKFLEKNMSLTVVKRNLEEKLEKLSEETAKLRSQADHNKKENEKLSEQLSFEKLERSSYEKMIRDMDSLQRQVEEHEKTIEALQLACMEKDRRIELIVQRRRKQRSNKAQQKSETPDCRLPLVSPDGTEEVVRFLLPARPRPGAAGIKETYYGYDDDSRSVDSELSSSSRLSSSRQSLDMTIDDDGDDNVFEEFTREQYAQNYQRLAAEHLELERSFALLQAQGVNSHIDPQREAKHRSLLESDLIDAQSRIEDLEKLVQVKGQDTGWIKEKEELNKELRLLKEKFAEQEDTEDKLKLQLSEMEEENEVMEFRVLELEDANEKLKEESRYTVTFTLPPVMTDDGVLQIYAEEKGIMEVSAAELQERLELLRTSQEVRLSVEEKVVLGQTAAMLNIADKKFKELQNTLSALWERIHLLEEEKARLLSDATGVSAEVVLEYESVNNQLIAAQLHISELQQEVENHKKEKAVFEYTSAIYEDTEKRYKSDIASLQRQLSSSHEGRDYETEIISTRLDQLKELERRLCAIDASRVELEEKVQSLTEENCELTASRKELQEQVNNLIEENTAIHANYTELLEQAESSHSKELLDQTESSQSKELLDQVESSHNKEHDDAGLPLSKKEHSVQVDNLSQCSSDSGVGPREQVEHLTRESSELRTQNKELQVQVEALKQASSELHQSKAEFYAHSNKQLLEELDNVNFDNCELRLSNKELQEQIEHLRQEKHSQNEELVTQLESSTLQTNNEELLIKVERLNENATLQNNNKELLAKVESLNEINSSLEISINELLAQVETSNGCNSTLQTSNKELVAQVQTFSEKNSELQISNTELLSKIESFNESYSTSQTNSKELLAQVETVNVKNTELQISNKELLAQVENLTKNNSTLQTSNKELLAQVDSLTENNSTLQTSNKELLAQVESLTENNSTLQTSNKELLAQVESLTENNSTLQTSNKELLAQVESLTENNSTLQTSNKELLAQVESLTENNSTVQTSNKELLAQVESLTENNSTLQTSNKELLAQVESLTENNSTLQTSNKELLAQVESLTENNSTVQTSNKELLAQVESLTENNSTLQTSNKELLAQVESLTENNSTVQTSNKELLAQVDSLTENNSTVQTTNKKLLAQVDSLTENNSTLQTSNKELLGEVDHLSEETSRWRKTKTEQRGQTSIIQTNGHEKADIELSEKSDQSNAVLKQRLAKYEAVKCDLTKSNLQLEENLRELGFRCTCMATDLLKAREEIKVLKQQQVSSPVLEGVKHSESSVHTQTLSRDSPELTPSQSLVSFCDDYIEADLGSSTSESGYGNMPRADDKHSGDSEYLKGNIVELVRQKEELETELWKLKAKLDSKTETLQECYIEKEQQEQEHVERVEQLSLELSRLTQQLEQMEHWHKKAEQLESSLRDTQSSESRLMEQLAMLRSNTTHRVDSLQIKVVDMEENKLQLGETVTELRSIEAELRAQIAECAETSHVDESEEQQIPLRIRQLEMSEDELRMKIDAVEAKLQQYQSSSDAQNDIQTCERRIVELEAQLHIGTDESDRLRAALEMQNEKIHSLEVTEQKLTSELIDATEAEKKLLMQMELLQDAEEKLMEKVERMESEEASLKRELSTVRDSNVACEAGERELQGRCDELRQMEEELRDTIGRLETRKKTLEARYEEDTDKLHNKLDLLLESEEKLLDRLQEQEQVEEELKEELKKSAQQLEQIKSEMLQQSKELDNAKKEIEAKQIELETYRHDMHMLSREKAKAEMELEKVKVDLQSAKAETSHMADQVKLLEQKVIKNDTTEETWMDYSRQRIEELECHEKQLKDTVNELEKSEAVLKMQVGSVEAAKKELSDSESRLREEINEHKMVAMSLKNTIRDLEKSESSLKTQVTNVESQNKELLMMVRSLQDKVAPSPYRLGQTSERLCDPMRARSPVYFDAIDGMTREEMASKIHELTRLERFHRAKITALSENLGSFREAVEVVTITMETDACCNVTEGKPRTKDSEFERRVNEIVATEVELKQTVAEWEKTAAAYKHQLAEAESALIEQEAEHRQELEQLEEEIDARRKGEARLKNQLQYGGDCNETDALAKIQHLEELVFDLEASERKLKRHLEDLEVNERKMTNELAEMEKTASIVMSSQDRNQSAVPVTHDYDRMSGVMSTQDHDRISGLLEQLRKAESSERSLKETLLRGESDTVVALRHQVAQLEQCQYSSYEREDSASVSALKHQVAQLEQSERGLRMKLRMLESSQEMTALERDSMHIDSPEAVLKRRIRQLEGVEQYMKQQLAELESDREELHDIARRDKNTIHDLTVQLRASQLSEKSLKDQLNCLEQQERHLVSKTNNMTVMLDELQEKLRSVQSSEQNLKAALQKWEHNDSEVTFKLATTEADLESTQQKLLSKMGELENEKREHYERCNELTDRIGDLEGVELTLKQKVRSLEGREASYESRILDLEQLESAAQLRVVELESLNESLSLRLRSTDDGRSSLMYEVTDLERSREKQLNDIDDLQRALRDVREQLDETQQQDRHLEDRLEEARDTEARLITELSELREKHDVVSNNSSKEAEFLTEQLDFHKRTLQQVEDDNLLLRDKLSMYECSVANNQMASVPRSELSWLRSQEAMHATLEEKARRLEQSEAYLKATVAELRIGKDVCGHDLELERLKNQVEQYNTLLQERDGLRKALTSMKKAHKLLKENSESLKQELREWQNKVKSGVVSALREKVNVNSKGVQVMLAEAVSLKRLSANEILYAMDHSEEFQSSLRSLSVNHPTAYQDFLKLMQPTECNISHIRVMSDDQLPTPTSNGSQFELQRVPAPKLGPGDTDDIVKTMNFFDETDDERSERSDSSFQRHTHCAIPPLPICLPPPASTLGGMESSNSSYYLPSPRRDEDTASADEASEIADEDGAGSIHIQNTSSKLSESSQARSVDHGLSRARSMDRDSFKERSVDRDTSSVDRDARSVDRDYSERSQLVLGSSDSSQKHSDTKLSASLDSIPDSGLSTLHQEAESQGVKAMIADFERQIKSRDLELENLRSTHREGASREHGHEELLIKLEDSDRYVTEQKETIVKMQSQMNTMQTLLKSKNIVLGEDGHYETLKETDNLATTRHLEETLETKSNEVEKLSKELHQWQLDCWTARDKVTKTEQTLNVVQHELDTLRTLTDQHTQLQWQYDTLTRENITLLAEKEKLVESGQESTTLEKIVLKLRGQLKALERVDLERQELAVKVKAAEEEIKEKGKREKQLRDEKAHLQRRIESLQAELKQLRRTVDRRGTADSKQDAVESLREQALLTITPLRAKVIRLASKCRAKDDLIGCLSRELRRSGGPTDLVAMAEREQAEGATEDYDRPISPLTASAIESFGSSVSSKEAAQMVAATSSRTTPTQLSQRQRHKQSMSTNNLDDVATEEDAEIDALMSSDLTSRPRRGSSHKTSPGRLDRSKSTPNCNAEFYDLSPLTLPPVTNRVREKMRGARRLLQHQQGGSTCKKDLYRAVKDYNPVYFSCSGRPELDLAFNEADILTVLGPVDETGYHEAELQGHRGLVPASYLLPLYPHAPPSSPRKHRRQTLHSSRVDLSPEQTPHRLLSSAPVTPTSDLRDIPSRSHKFTGAHPAFSTQSSALPAAVTPRSMRPGSHPAFQSPTPGGPHFSGASTLPRAHRRLPSPAIQSPPPLDTSQAVPLASPIDDGQPDAPTNFQIERIVGSHSVLLCWMTPLLDEFGHNNGSRVEGYKICIDSRDKLTVSSAHLTKALIEQLDLHKSHSFSIQTVAENGKMSAIVSVLFHEVAPQLVGRSSAGDEGTSEHGSTPGNSPRKPGDGRDTLRERRVFMAVYDYTPCKLSTLTRPRQELSFRTGDIIITYGPPGTDGFYYGKVHGKKGYIPASFIEEIALLKSKSRRSMSTNSLASQHSASSVASTTKRSRPLNLGISTDV